MLENEEEIQIILFILKKFKSLQQPRENSECGKNKRQKKF